MLRLTSLVENLTGEFMREYANFIHALSTRTASRNHHETLQTRGRTFICSVLDSEKEGKERIIMF